MAEQINKWHVKEEGAYWMNHEILSFVIGLIALAIALLMIEVAGVIKDLFITFKQLAKENMSNRNAKKKHRLC